MSVHAVATVASYKSGSSARKFVLMAVANNNWEVNISSIHKATEIPISRIEKIVSSQIFKDQMLILMATCGESR
jgi:hypothetical protein